jgi:hypothetical protein
MFALTRHGALRELRRLEEEAISSWRASVEALGTSPGTSGAIDDMSVINSIGAHMTPGE